jgi:hypothetical protein
MGNSFDRLHIYASTLDVSIKHVCQFVDRVFEDVD